MSEPLLLNLSAFISLLPFTLVAWKHPRRSLLMFWLMLGVAICGSLLVLVAHTQSGWPTDFATAIWVSVFSSLVLYALVCIRQQEARKLGHLVGLYLLIVAGGAVVWGGVDDSNPLPPIQAMSVWVLFHIFVSVATYGLVTLAALASLAAVLQERALKAKKPKTPNRSLPALADCDQLTFQMLLVGELVLALGLLSGVAVQFAESGSFLVFNHKTLLSVIAFLLIGGLLFAHYRSGLRGRKAARMVLLGYLLLTLGYPGVKFVTDVLLSA